ncbi:hypothetical protein C8R45DRAFT_1013690 [Mycena sanguinolenta]|nr:hypothetical protein C8R45DRAFT_1013690 [Mycena sanguinolenta]
MGRAVCVHLAPSCPRMRSFMLNGVGLVGALGVGRAFDFLLHCDNLSRALGAPARHLATAQSLTFVLGLFISICVSFFSAWRSTAPASLSAHA